MSKILLITNPAHDIATQYFEAWSRDIIDQAKRDGVVEVLELQGPAVTRNKLTEVVESQKPKLIIFNGHGDENTISGFKSNILIRHGDNESLLRDKIVHSLACEAGRKIALECVRIGTLAFIGYKNKFRGAYDVNAKTPEAMRRDAYAELIMEPAFTAISMLVAGSTAGDAHRRSQEYYAENLNILLAGPKTYASLEIAKRIYDNLNNQVCFGDPRVRF